MGFLRAAHTRRNADDRRESRSGSNAGSSAGTPRFKANENFRAIGGSSQPEKRKLSTGGKALTKKQKRRLAIEQRKKKQQRRGCLSGLAGMLCGAGGKGTDEVVPA